MLDSFVLFSLLAAFLWAIANVLDKLVITDFLDDPASITFFTSIFGVLVALATPVFSSIRYPGALNLGIMIAIGAFSVLPLYLYMRSIQLEEVSRVIPIFSLEPVFVLVLGAIFLQEYFTPEKYLGIFLTVTGAVMVSSKRFGKEFFHLEANRAFWMVFTGTFCYSIYQVSVRAALGQIDFWNVFFWTRMGSLLPLLLFFFHGKSRENLIKVFSSLSEHRIEIIGLSELVNNIAIFLQVVALSLGPAALVVTATSVQPLLFLVLVGFLSYFLDKDIGEDLSSKAVVVKTFSAVLILVGIYLIK